MIIKLKNLFHLIATEVSAFLISAELFIPSQLKNTKKLKKHSILRIFYKL
jgi:hypothetical protein